MRNAAIALLGVPIIVAVYVGALLRRSAVTRLAVALVLSGILGAGIVGAVLVPGAVTARPPAPPIVPLTRAEFRTVVATNASLTAPVAIEFTTPMNKGSVAASVIVDPPIPVDLAWDAAGDTLTISPTGTWAPGTYHSVSVQAGALAGTGQPLARPARAAFLTRPPTSTSAIVTAPLGERVSVQTAFNVTFSGPVDAASVRSGITLDPSTPGSVEAVGMNDGPISFAFVPSDSLKPDTAYRLLVSGVRDRDGLELAPQSIDVRTVAAPGVIRFRPRADTEDASRGAPVSVRFTEPMDRTTTGRAFSVRIGGKVIKGTISWVESDTVLVFKPATALPFDAAVVAKVDITATSATGAPLARSVRAIFHTVAKPKPAAAAPSRPVAAPNAGTTGGGGAAGTAVGAGSWAAVETYYLRLMNCTRTGGWVTSSGSCSSPGGRAVAPLWIDAGISARVARPYAKLLSTRGICNHFIGGNPGSRLARAGYSSYRWAENLGCRAGNPTSAVLGSHLFFQSEKSYLGGHYVNLMNPDYDRVGLGVWVSSGRVRLVVDFYHP